MCGPRPANCERPIWGHLPWPPLQSLPRVAIVVTDSPLTPQQTVTAGIGSWAGWCPGRWTFSLPRVLDWGSVRGVLLKLGSSRTGACKREGRVSREAPGSEKGQEAARAFPQAGPSAFSGVSLLLSSAPFYFEHFPIYS